MSEIKKQESSNKKATEVPSEDIFRDLQVHRGSEFYGVLMELAQNIAEERIYADYRLAQAAMNEGQNSTLFSDLREDVGQDELDWDVDLEAEEYSVVGETHNKKDDSVFLVPATPKKGSRTPLVPRPDSPVPFVPRKSRRLASLGPLEADDILLTSRGNNGTSPRAPTTPKTPRAPRAPRTPKTPARPRKK